MSVTATLGNINWVIQKNSTAQMNAINTFDEYGFLEFVTLYDADVVVVVVSVLEE